jgi:hypothetical protein
MVCLCHGLFLHLWCVLQQFMHLDYASHVCNDVFPNRLYSDSKILKSSNHAIAIHPCKLFFVCKDIGCADSALFARSYIELVNKFVGLTAPDATP